MNLNLPSAHDDIRHYYGEVLQFSGDLKTVLKPGGELYFSDVSATAGACC